MRDDRTSTTRDFLRRAGAALLAGVVALLIPAMAATTASADFAPAVRTCRAAVGRSATRLARTMLKTITTCHKQRDGDGTMAGVDCNDLAAADTDGAVTAAEHKFTVALVSSAGRCAGVAPTDALYSECAAPCDAEVTTIQTFADVAQCLDCLARSRIQAMSTAIHGTPGSPLPSADRRCEETIGSASAMLFQRVLRDVTRCQADEENAGATTTGFCTDAAFPSHAVEDAAFHAENAIVGSCDLPSFANLDSCADSRFAVARCAGDDTLEAARRLTGEVLSLPATTTTTTTTTTTLPSVVGDPQCPDAGELLLFSHDTNTPCTTNADCPAPRHCNASAGICASVSDLDTGWTGNAHNSDLDDSVLTRSRLLCPGPAPTCGECIVNGVDPSTGACRCSNDTRTICDKPFAPDSGNCGGAVCDCYYGVPIPLSSAGTPACIVNRYAQDITGTVNVDLGSSEIAARLKTKVYLGISTTTPCPFCAGTCSNDASRSCVFDSDCDAGNTCIQDTPNDGIRGGRCFDGANDGLPCDVGGTNPSFPAHAGALLGGGGYSLDCMPAVGKNISGAGLTLNVTQTTGTQTLSADLPCSGGTCFCKTCSATPSVPCSSDSGCSGGSCAVSANFSCTSNSDCSSLDLGTCASIKRCSAATNVTCTTNADCQNYASGGPCMPSTCSAIGAGTAPSANACDGGSCSDAGDAQGTCATGPDDKTCDGLLRADGRGILTCNSNADCTANDPLNGNCTLIERRACFLDPIVAAGTADPAYPVGAAVFCVPPTSSASINQVAGLPGPARAVNQSGSRAFCASDQQIEYHPGTGGCP